MAKSAGVPIGACSGSDAAGKQGRARGCRIIEHHSSAVGASLVMLFDLGVKSVIARVVLGCPKSFRKLKSHPRGTRRAIRKLPLRGRRVEFDHDRSSGTFNRFGKSR